MNENPKIDRHLCFVCDRSWPLFTDGDSKGIGGVETRSVRLAEMMSKYFRQVTFALKDNGSKVVNYRGMEIAFYEPATISNAPNPGLIKIDADIYVVFESNYITADAVRTCNIMKRIVVFWATSMNDFNVLYKLDNHNSYLWNFVARESAYCFYFSNYIISQTIDQKQALYRNHGLNSIVIKNPIQVNEDVFQILAKKAPGKETVLWIGRTDPYNKRPDLLLKIAARLGNVDFLMILNNVDDAYFNKIIQEKTSNIEIREYINPDKMSEVFKECSIFLSTSSKEFEGFPNVFLQAIMHALPIVSLEVDPDGMFSEQGCGISCAGSIDRAIHEIDMLINSPDQKIPIINKAFKYIKQNHSVELIEKQMVDIFSSISPFTEDKYKWTEYKFDRINEKLRLDYNQLLLMNEHQSSYHYTLINSREIRIINSIRKAIGKEIWK